MTKKRKIDDEQVDESIESFSKTNNIPIAQFEDAISIDELLPEENDTTEDDDEEEKAKQGLAMWVKYQKKNSPLSENKQKFLELQDHGSMSDLKKIFKELKNEDIFENDAAYIADVWKSIIFYFDRYIEGEDDNVNFSMMIKMFESSREMYKYLQ